MRTLRNAQTSYVARSVVCDFEFWNLGKSPEMLSKKSEKWPEVWFGGCAWGYMGLDGFPVLLGVTLGPPGGPLSALSGTIGKL